MDRVLVKRGLQGLVVVVSVGLGAGYVWKVQRDAGRVAEPGYIQDGSSVEVEVVDAEGKVRTVILGTKSMSGAAIDSLLVKFDPPEIPRQFQTGDGPTTDPFTEATEPKVGTSSTALNEGIAGTTIPSQPVLWLGGGIELVSPLWRESSVISSSKSGAIFTPPPETFFRASDRLPTVKP